jgi:hypothetical protein
VGPYALVRQGRRCLLTGKPNGRLSVTTKAALGHYFTIGGQPIEPDKISLTQTRVGELTKHSTRVFPIQCKSDETLKGHSCVANEKPGAAAATSRKSDDDEKPRRKPSTREADRDPVKRAKIENVAPRARQQAVPRPSIRQRW